jgi:hypothetical protein
MAIERIRLFRPMGILSCDYFSEPQMQHPTDAVMEDIKLARDKIFYLADSWH